MHKICNLTITLPLGLKTTKSWQKHIKTRCICANLLCKMPIIFNHKAQKQIKTTTESHIIPTYFIEKLAKN